MDKNKIEDVSYAPSKRLGVPLVMFTVGAVLAGSENRGVKALGAGIAVASMLNLLNKLAAMVE